MHRFLFFMAMMLTGCASLKRVAWVPAPDSTQVLEFRYGGAFDTQTRYIADGVRACRETSEPRQGRDGVTYYPLKRQVIVIPSAEKWKEFWGKLDQLEVAHWKQEYTPEEVGVTVFGGTQWWLNTSTIRGASQSTGDNAYPMIENPRRTTIEDAAFRELQKAFEALIDAPSTTALFTHHAPRQAPVRPSMSIAD